MHLCTAIIFPTHFKIYELEDNFEDIILIFSPLNQTCKQLGQKDGFQESILLNEQTLSDTLGRILYIFQWHVDILVINFIN